MACSSVLKGGGTNQELVLHCLHECGGDFLVSTVTHNDSLSLTAVHFAGFVAEKNLIKTKSLTSAEFLICKQESFTY